MQAYEGYFEGRHFYPKETDAEIPEHQRVVVTVLDEAVQEDEIIKRRLEAIDSFRKAMREIDARGDEPVPEFERVKFTREVDL